MNYDDETLDTSGNIFLELKKLEY